MSNEDNQVPKSNRTNDIVELRKQRGILRARLTQFKRFLANFNTEPPSKLQIKEIKARMIAAAEHYNNFNNIETQIELRCHESDIESNIEYVEQFESLYFTALAIAEGLIEGGETVSGSRVSNVPVNNVKLPEITLASFDGSYDNWLEFRNSFITMIHKRTDLDPIQKLHYLRSALSGPAKQVISALDFTADNYLVAWDLLDSRYHNIRLLVHNHVKALFSISPIKYESASHVRKLIDTVKRNLRALNTLQEPTDSWDTLIIYMVVSKLDSATEREWENHLGIICSDPKKRNGQGLQSSGSGSQGKDPLAPALPGSRNMYQHPAVTGYNPQDRNQSMPVTNALYSGIYHGYGAGAGATLAPLPSPSPTAPLPPFPVHPDVKFKKLPFYDVLAELMKPSTMMPMQATRMQEGTFIFHLTPQQATEIASGKDVVGTTNKLDYVIQAQLRFCLLETSCEQEDYFPPSVNVKVNNKMCPLPNPIPTNKPTPEPKRPPRPVNISSLVKLSPTVANTIHVTWASDFTRAYVLSVFMVRKLTSTELLQRLKNKGTKNPDYTRSLIKEKLSEDYDSEIATTSLRVSLMCPLGKMRMSCPCRPAACPHLQCFDASLFLQMNERKPTWVCPVCDRPAPYDSLVVDGYFQEVLTSPRLASECNEIQLHADGNWSAHVPPPRAPPPQPAAAAAEPVTLIADDLEVIPVDANGGAKRAAVGESRTAKVVDVLVDLTSDSEDELPLKRKVPQTSPAPAPSEDYSTTNTTEAVSSSGYRSPSASGGAVISLDSPSPPAPTTPPAPAAAEAQPDCTSNNAEREEESSTHWAPYAEADRDAHDSYRRY